MNIVVETQIILQNADVLIYISSYLINEYNDICCQLLVLLVSPNLFFFRFV